MNDINIYVIRHCESEFNVIPDMIGQPADSKPTENGISQCNLLGHHFKNKNIEFDEIVSSSYLRAKTTAGIFSKIVGYKKELTLTNSLVEYNPGDWRGSKRSEIYSDIKNLKDITYLHMGFPFPNGETYHQVERRATTLIENHIIYNKEILAAAEQKELNIALFSHGMTIKTILHYVMGYDQSFMWRIRIGNTGVSHLVYNDKGWFLNTINDQSHLTTR